MWEPVLFWLPIFGAIIVGALLLPGLLMGVNHSLKHVFGFSNDVLFGYSKKEVMGIIPAIILGAGICSIIAGLLGIEAVYLDADAVSVLFGKEVNPVYAIMSISGFFGLLNASFVTGFKWLASEEFFKKRIRWFYRVASWLAGAIVGSQFGIGGFVSGLLAGILIGKSVGVLVYGYAMLAFPIAVHIIMPHFILWRCKTIICNNCLRYTQPLKSRYEYGTRYCELCDKPVEYTKDPGQVFLIFGNFPLKSEGRTFMLTNPDFEHKDHRVDVSVVYIDTPTCDWRLLERFITYILNYPPKQGLRAMQIFYRGNLDDLGDNLKNVLQNNFERIEKMG